MRLSASKTELFLNSKGFVIQKYFVNSSNCIIIEVISISTMENFIITIPQKYNFSVENCVSRNVFEVEGLQANDDGYVDVLPDNLQDTYKSIEIEQTVESPTLEKLEEAYNHPITLEELTRDDKSAIKDIQRQIRRFRLCVKNIRYKLAIFYKYYICILDSQNNIVSFYNKSRKTNDNIKRLLVVIDLEFIYENSNKVDSDIRQIKKEIYDIIEKNRILHSSNLKLLIEEKKSAFIFPDDMFKKQAELTEYQSRFNELLLKLLDSEKILLIKLEKLSYKQGEQSNQGVYSDSQVYHEKNAIEKELDVVSSVKDDVLKNIIEIKDTIGNALLSVDKILFDNSVMLGEIIRNFSYLSSVAKLM